MNAHRLALIDHHVDGPTAGIHGGVIEHHHGGIGGKLQPHPVPNQGCPAPTQPPGTCGKLGCACPIGLVRILLVACLVILQLAMEDLDQNFPVLHQTIKSQEALHELQLQETCQARSSELLQALSYLRPVGWRCWIHPDVGSMGLLVAKSMDQPQHVQHLLDHPLRHGNFNSSPWHRGSSSRTTVCHGSRGL